MNEKTRILICDDEPHILHVVGLKLRAAGFEVAIAANGEQALKAAAKHSPALCVVDYNMPGMNGAELCQQLRAMPHLAALPIVLLTAMDYRLLQFGDSDTAPSAVMGKPFSPRALVQQVQALIKPCEALEAG